MRIASLIASATEIVAALGLERDLVCRSHECDFPESVKRLPSVSEPKFPIDGSSYQIDQRVKALVAEGLSVYRIDAQLLRTLAPEVIITQTQCEVCAVSRTDVEHALRDWLDSAPRIVSLEPNSLDDVFGDIRKVARALGAEQAAESLVARMKQRMTGVATQTDSASHRPGVACIEWIDPLMAGGNWMPELVAMAGGVNLFGRSGEHSPFLSFESLAEHNPEVICCLPCGYDIQTTEREMPALTQRPGWSSLSAVRNQRVYLLDGNRYFNRPGPRLVESLEILAEILHPEQFNFGHRGDGWIQYGA